MPITLNKTKDFKKTDGKPSSTLKAQDETIQITKKEWEAMQESLSQLQTFMNDLVEGNLEIEIIDDTKELEEPKEEKEEVEIEMDQPKEEVEEPTEEASEKPSEEEEKAEDADMEEVLKDPAKRKAVLEYLKATDANHPVKDMSLSQLRKRVSTIVSREDFDLAKKGTVKMTPAEVINEIMSQVKKEKKNNEGITVEKLGKIANKFLNSLDLQNSKKAKDSKPMKRKTIKKSVDSAIPDFTSRFDDKPRFKKAVDNSKKDLSKEFSNRFN